MKRILLVGSTQIEHIAELLSKNGYETKVLQCKNRSRWDIIKYYWDFMIELCKCSQVYIVYAEPILLAVARIFKKKVILHWIGTDVYNYINHIGTWGTFTKRFFHVTGSQLLHDELEVMGIQSDIIPIIPFGMKLDLMKMPEEHAALVYLPTGKEEFYRADIIRDLAIRNPSMKFHIVANEGYELLKLHNVVFHGRLDADEMNDLYNQISILIRLPEHDGLSMMVIESLAKGKQVLYRYDHPFVYTPASLEMDDVNTKLKKIIEQKPELNIQGHNYIIEHYTEENMMKLYNRYKIFD